MIRSSRLFGSHSLRSGIIVAAALPVAAYLLWPGGATTGRRGVQLPLASLPHHVKETAATVEGHGGEAMEVSDSRRDSELIGGAAGQQAPAADAGSAVPVPTDDESLRQRLLGKWTQNNYGRRLLTVLADGTATIDVEPEGIWRHVFGERIRINVVWRIENGRVRFESTGGDPPEKAELVAKSFGTSGDRAIVVLTGERLALLEDGKTEPSEWSRVE